MATTNDRGYDLSRTLHRACGPDMVRGDAVGLKNSNVFVTEFGMHDSKGPPEFA